MKHAVRAAALFAVASACLSSPSRAAPPPAEAFGRLPAVQDARISPDGKHIAILGEGPGGKRVVSISPIDSKQTAILGLGEVTTRRLRWAGDNNVLVLGSYYVIDRDHPKAHYHFNRWISVDTTGKPLGRLGVEGDINDFITDLPLLTIIDGAKPAAALQGVDQTEVDDTYANRTHMKSQMPQVTMAIYRVDVATGKSSGILERGGLHTAAWSTDLSGAGRVRVDINEVNHDYILLGRGKGGGAWKELDRSADEDDAESYLGYSDREDAAFIAVSKPNGDGAIERHNLADGTVTTLAPSQPAPYADLLWDDNVMAPVALTYTGERTSYDWFDKDIGAVHDKLARAFAGKDVNLVNWSRDRTRFVVDVEAGDAAPSYYLLDAGQKSISPLGDAYPELKGQPLGRKTWISYKAADGLEISAYLTLPPGAAAEGGKLPLIIMPHGGPDARDAPGFDWWAQFIASRGYAVLQPQFRGSGGFGRAFRLAGRRQWSDKMQTDLLDGIAALAAKGVIDPARVCIVGASYGGYAALAAETLHPEAYRCAVSVNGLSDLGAFVSQQMRTGGGFDSGAVRALRRQIGWSNGSTVSPTHLAEHAGGPILLVHSREDTTVYYEQSERMKAALEDKSKPVELVTLEGDDHYLSDAASRITMLKAIDAFLAKNLPVQAR